MHSSHPAELDDLFQHNTFLPDSTPDRFNRLLDHVSQHRYTALAALYAEAYRLFPGDHELGEFFTRTADLILLPAPQRQAIINEPVFQIWTRRAVQLTHAVLDGSEPDRSVLRSSLQALPALLQRIAHGVAEHQQADCPALRRFDLDPLLVAELAPCYAFPEDEATRLEIQNSGYSLEFFSDVLNVALSRIAMTWPGCHRQFRQLVRLICYLPDGNFRSGSAVRYGGAILLSAREHSLLDIEESLVRETAHQLFYYIEEIAPLIDPQADEERLYFLPWSNRPCGLSTYFQTFLAQLMRAKYLERVRQRPASELQRIEERLIFILRGLGRALPTLSGNTELTPRGRVLLDNLAEAVQAMERHHARLLDSTDGLHDLNLAV